MACLWHAKFFHWASPNSCIVLHVYIKYRVQKAIKHLNYFRYRTLFLAYLMKKCFVKGYITTGESKLKCLFSLLIILHKNKKTSFCVICKHFFNLQFILNLFSIWFFHIKCELGKYDFCEMNFPKDQSRQFLLPLFEKYLCIERLFTCFV